MNTLALELHTNEEPALAKMYELLLRFETEEMKECMIKCTKNCGYNTQVEQRRLHDNLQEKFYKMTCHMTPEKSSRMYKSTSQL